jgi:hypothetical protein
MVSKTERQPPRSCVALQLLCVMYSEHYLVVIHSFYYFATNHTTSHAVEHTERMIITTTFS